MNKKVIAAIKAHAIAEFPKESCGLVVKKGRSITYRPCVNRHDKPHEAFRIARQEYAEVRSEGFEVVGIAHSHPNASSKPSAGDLVALEESQLPWFIVSTFLDLEGDRSVLAGEVMRYDPTGFVHPLEGREFVHGVLDCYAIIRDGYKQECGIDLPDFEREDGWWEKEGSESLYLKNFEAAGFEVAISERSRFLTDMRKYDVILMEIASKAGPNHAALYLGDGMIIHHMYGRPSKKGVYGGYWQDATRMVLRHKELKVDCSPP